VIEEGSGRRTSLIMEWKLRSEHLYMHMHIELVGVSLRALIGRRWHA